MHELTPQSLAPLIIQSRGGLNESFHLGTMALVSPTGAVLESAGDIQALIYPRSALKPLQALAMKQLGLELEPKLWAIAMASHYATDEQVGLVEQLLEKFGNHENDLACPPAWPWNPECRARASQQRRVFMNCSGKHAGFLATCKVVGSEVSSYLSPESPVQVRIRELVEELSGEQISKVTIDGCGAPLYAISTYGLATALSHFPAMANDLVEAGFSYPNLIGDVTTPDAVLMRRGIFSKLGAEGVFTAVTQDGYALAIKFADGSLRGAIRLAAHVLAKHSLISKQALAELLEADSWQVLGAGKPVGEIKISL